MSDTLIRSSRLLAGGVCEPSYDGGVFETRDSATGEVIGTVAEATPEDVDWAVEEGVLRHLTSAEIDRNYTDTHAASVWR